MANKNEPMCNCLSLSKLIVSKREKVCSGNASFMIRYEEEVVSLLGGNWGTV